LYNTNGATGAALGAGIYSSADEAFGNLKCIQRISPDSYQEMITNNYHQWEKLIHMQLQK
jgi:xylulokinase